MIEVIKSLLLIAAAGYLCYLAYINRNSKEKAKYLLILMGFMLLVSVFCTYAADLNNYRYAYQSYPKIVPVRAIGFDFIHNLFCAIGLPFGVFKMFCALFTISLTAFVFWKYTDYAVVGMILFLIYPFTGTITQIRNGMAAAIVFLAIANYTMDSTHNKVQYAVTILFACLLHYSVAFYLILLMADHRLSIKKTVLVSLGIIAALFLMIYGNLAYRILGTLMPQRIAVWLDFGQATAWASDPNNYNLTGKTVIVGGLLVLGFCTYVLYAAYYRIIRNTYTAQRVRACKRRTDRIAFILKCGILMCSVLPLLLLSPTYFRYVKNFLPVVYLLAANYLSFSEKREDPRQTRIAQCFVAGLAVVAVGACAMASFSQESILGLLGSFFVFEGI